MPTYLRASKANNWIPTLPTVVELRERPESGQADRQLVTSLVLQAAQSQATPARRLDLPALSGVSLVL